MTKNQDIFSFNKENLTKAKAIIAKYPEGKQKSATLPLLDIAQRQNNGWLSIAAMEYVADMISEPYMRIYEIATFYTMFNLKPVGKYHLQICGTTPCWLRGAAEIMSECEQLTETKCGNTSDNGMFTVTEVECLGACRNAPVMQVNDDLYEDLNSKSLKKLIKELKSKDK